MVSRMRTRHFAQAKAEGRKISCLTAYDAPTAAIFDEAGIDLLLVGDSAANVVLGQESTLSITVEEMMTMATAVARATQRAFVVSDLPFGSYEVSPAQALETAARFMKETGVAAVKIEGGVEIAPTIRALVDAGIPVMAHIGYTPQSEHALGGYVVQGRGAGAEKLRADARAVRDAGAFAVVLEMVPAGVAGEITRELDIPTIGIAQVPTPTARSWCGPTPSASPGAGRRGSRVVTRKSATCFSPPPVPTARTSRTVPPRTSPSPSGTSSDGRRAHRRAAPGGSRRP